MTANDSLSELYQPTGGDFGGTRVDHKFIDVLTRIFGADILRTFKDTHTHEYWDLMEDFELKKRNFDASSRVILKCPPSFLQIYEDTVGMSVSQSLQNSNLMGKVEFKIGKIMLEATLVKGFFDGPVDDIVNATEDLLKQVGGLQHIIMVGGFSESPYLQKVMMEKFGDMVVIPDQPSGAVVNGAVIYGHKRGAISSRVCKFTYGIAQIMKFKSHHPDNKKRTYGGIAYCEDLFSKHIEIGEKVSLDSTEANEIEYFPPAADAIHVALEVYASSRKNPTFVDENGCQLVGLIKLEINTQGNFWAKLLVQMKFGGTELEIQVTEVNTGSKTMAYVDFLG